MDHLGDVSMDGRIIKMDFKETGWEAQERVQCWALMNIIITSGSMKGREFLDCMSDY
jgi:hypothetical protein